MPSALPQVSALPVDRRFGAVNNDSFARKAIVVADSSSLRHSTMAKLRSYGYEVQVASSGLEALEIYEADPVSLIISGWMMPGMDGLELCTRIRRLQAPDYAYFILMTSKGDKQDVAAGLNAGADDYISRPVDKNELLARIQAGERIMALQRSLMDRHQEISSAHEKLQRIHTELEDDLRLAAKVQNTYIPAALGTCKDVPIAAIYRPCTHVSGDLIGYFELNKDEIAVYSIDVSGHGVAAALMSVSLSQAFNPFDRQNNVAFDTGPDGSQIVLEPHQVIERLNTRYQGDAETDQYFTMAFARINVFNGVVNLCQAGHPNPAIVRSAGKVEFAGAGGPPVGLLPDAEFESTQLKLERGDSFFLYSDGIIDCLEPDDLRTGDCILSDILLECAEAPLASFSTNLTGKITQRSGTPVLSDDLSALYIHFATGRDRNQIQSHV